MGWFEQVPKVELHVHLEGAIPPAALWQLIEHYGGDPSVPSVEALEARFVYRDFAHFIEAWAWKNQFLRHYEDFTHIAELTAREFAAQQIRYAEMFYSPSLFVRHQGLDAQRITEAVRAGLARVPEIEVALIADLVRDYGPDHEQPILEALAEQKALGVLGIGLGGSEQEFPPEAFAPLYRRARELGLHTTAHAGEGAGPASVWGALDALHVERIGHGTRAIEDPRLVDVLAERAIALELCPISNVRTGVVARLDEHPIRRYLDRGLLVSVNTDDPRMFNTTLAGEFAALERECGFSRADIRALILMAIESSWLAPEKKGELRAAFAQDPAWNASV